MDKDAQSRHKRNHSYVTNPSQTPSKQTQQKPKLSFYEGGDSDNLLNNMDFDHIDVPKAAKKRSTNDMSFNG